MTRYFVLTSLAYQARWPNVTRTPWPEADPLLHHFIVAWPQSWCASHDKCGMAIVSVES